MGEWLEATVVEKIRWNDGLFSLRFDAPLPAFKAGQFVRVGLDVDGERIARPYSLVNAPDETPHEIYFNVVPEGPLSPRLARLEAGDLFQVHSSVTGTMTMERTPEHRHLWLFATGTALGPFLSMLKTDAPWQRAERVVLCHSVRTASDLTYGDTIRELLHRYGNRLTFVPLVTRETVTGTLQQRIPAALDSGDIERLVGLTLRPEDAHVMLCGNSDMIEAVQQRLEARGLRRHRRREPGHVTVEKYH
ncbi:ferredoxin--NADP reductase [Guyparkeria hydrothermalis]|uniref:ferredoxin--NADP reductase n=1 Tax=Guyparkeria hydrothermalis TaxID=923 RepID=UPI0020206203|nr:ferredoxin--NADP reductase [Guyparkeria hydrothermalis]MCL7744769.1 ferredoxin--NADP reductase [Guyparkeria hydrothermalis]